MTDPVTRAENAHSTVWFALKRLDLNDHGVVALREVHIPRGTKMTTVRQIVAHSFRLDLAKVTLKVRNSHGFLIPLNGYIPVNTKQMPYVLEVARYFQHVINKSLKSRVQSIVKRIERLEELLPQIKQKQNEILVKDIELLNQKLIFLHKRMQMAESYSWEGMFKRAPLW
ncbi:uncharacterized protein si:zfos-1056e6.1 isoform X2 [Clarias gariepinus]|uniref:uncharacterized protein si:zfos-1056e6.1 isoform X2 n=1 Tax=Clarias gariepinus TaxID=13013 RepID=UPI00234DF28A|nr:uncharacterized protein si:zfos-1056e6.1 isoform X2 [Clarias gariepinus]